MAEGKQTTMDALHHHLVQAKMMVERNKIWAGVEGWHHNPLSVPHKMEALRHLEAALKQMLVLKDDIAALEELAGISHGG